MRKKLFILSLSCVLFVFTAFAQTNNSSAGSSMLQPSNQSSDITAGQQSDSNQTGGLSDQSTQAQPSMPQSNTNTARTAEDSAADQGGIPRVNNDAILEGCVVSQGADHYLQSSTGIPIRLSGFDAASYAGQQVRVHGSEANPKANAPEFQVDRVQVVSTTCPASKINENRMGRDQ